MPKEGAGERAGAETLGRECDLKRGARTGLRRGGMSPNHESAPLRGANGVEIVRSLFLPGGEVIANGCGDHAPFCILISLLA